MVDDYIYTEGDYYDRALNEQTKTRMMLAALLSTDDQISSFRLPVEEGAYLTAVYDSSLEPDEVFIQVSPSRKFVAATVID
jgi:hypothetical protein